MAQVFPPVSLFLRKDRPQERQDKVLLVYAARHYRELSAQNELRPQDVMRILVHYHAYGDPAKVPDLVAHHAARISEEIGEREEDEVGRSLPSTTAMRRRCLFSSSILQHTGAKVARQVQKLQARILERDDRVADARRAARSTTGAT